MKPYFNRAVLIVVSLWLFPVLLSGAEMHNHQSSQNDVQKRIVFGGDENYPPFLFRDDDGNPAGYHIDLITAIADALDYQIEIRLKKWDDVMQDLLINKTIDITSLAYQKRREKIVLFSTPHLIETSDIFIRKNSRGIESLDDLRGKEIILMRNATTHMNLEDKNFKAKYHCCPGKFI